MRRLMKTRRIHNDPAGWARFWRVQLAGLYFALGAMLIAGIVSYQADQQAQRQLQELQRSR